MKPVPKHVSAERMRAVAVSTFVNNPRNQGPDCVAAVPVSIVADFLSVPLKEQRSPWDDMIQILFEAGDTQSKQLPYRPTRNPATGRVSINQCEKSDQFARELPEPGGPRTGRP